MRRNSIIGETTLIGATSLGLTRQNLGRRCDVKGDVTYNNQQVLNNKYTLFLQNKSKYRRKPRSTASEAPSQRNSLSSIILTCSTSMPLAHTLVVMSSFSFPSRNLFSTAIRCSTVISPDNSATAWPSSVIFCANHETALRVWKKIQLLWSKSVVRYSRSLNLW